MITKLKAEIAKLQSKNDIEAFVPLIKDMELMCNAMEHVIDAKDADAELTQFELQELLHSYFMDNQEN